MYLVFSNKLHARKYRQKSTTVSDLVDRWKIIYDGFDEVEIGYGTCQQILIEDLNIHRIAARFVSKFVIKYQKGETRTLERSELDVATYQYGGTQFLLHTTVFGSELNESASPFLFSPNLALCDFGLLPRIKIKLKVDILTFWKKFKQNRRQH